MNIELQNVKNTMVVQTVFFHESDRDAAFVLGKRLYDTLTRPIDDPLSFGAGIPVYSAVSHECVDFNQAKYVALIPVLGKSTFGLMADTVINTLNQWHSQLGSSHVLPVLIDGSWRTRQAIMLGNPLLTELYQPSEDQSATVLEICSSLVRILQGEKQKKPSIFISHAKADESDTRHAAKTIADFVETDTRIRSFYDRVDLFPGELLQEGIENSLKDGVLIVVRGDKYSSRIWCQHELLVAKRNCLPTLTVEVLTRGERRSLPYGGNSPTIVWRDDKPLVIATEAMVEYLKALHFMVDSQRMIQLASLPNDSQTLIRAPELLDFSQGRLNLNGPQFVIYPDPELTTLERDVIRAANPQIRMSTPTTIFRRSLIDDGNSSVTTPLQGLEVGISLSNVLEGTNDFGYTEEHMKDMTILLARTLISSGACLAYGGDWRRDGFTFLFSELIQAYNQSSLDSTELLKNYIAAQIPLSEQPANLPIALMHLKERKELRDVALVPTDSTHPGPLYFSDMRRVMTRRIIARVLIGGQAVPKKEPGPVGYGGLFPGVVEEAWWSLTANPPQPAYPVGGFGGAAELVAQLLISGFEGRDDTPTSLQNETWKDLEFFQNTRKAVLADEYHKKLGLPDSMQEMAQQIIDFGKSLAAQNGFEEWNGLTLEENKLLFFSRDPLMITTLINKGLLSKLRQQSRGKLNVELVNASVTDARDLDLLALAAFDDVPLGGAGEALNQRISNIASLARSNGSALISLQGQPVGADWLFLASLGRLTDKLDVDARIRQAAIETVQTAERHGFRRIGVVAFGGNFVENAQQVARSMIDGMQALADAGKVTWFENDPSRFEQYRSFLESDEQVTLTLPKLTRRQAPKSDSPTKIYLQTFWDKSNSVLRVGLLLPTGSALHSLDERVLSESEVNDFAYGLPPDGRSTPSFADLESRGKELAQKLLGELAEQVISITASEKTNLVWIHDVESSRIPFELLSGATVPTINVSVSRRLAVPGVPFERLVPRPSSSGKLRVLLVIDPTSDLHGAAMEGQAAKDVLESIPGIELSVLRGAEASHKTFKKEVSKSDYLHYCGHAFFDGPGERESGLVLRDGNFTLSDLRGIEAPRVAFVNACEAGRVRYRGEVKKRRPEQFAASFAEFFLRSGVDAYIGTYWLVGDAAAKLFAETLYKELLTGQTLDQAVTTGRKRLFESSLNDWANYLLYGDGRFKLVGD